jgi:hypothetical protein
MKYLKLFELSYLTWKDAFNNELKRLDNLNIKGGIFTPTRINKFAKKYSESLLDELIKLYDNKYQCNPETELLNNTNFKKEISRLL